MSKQKENDQEENGHNIVEKITFIFGLLVLVGLISFLIYQMSNKSNLPPQLVISTQYEPQLDHYGFKVDVENKGDFSAEAANIKLSLYQNGESVEDGTLEFQYIPVKSKETGWIVFHTSRKSGDSLVVSSLTYAKP